MSFEETKAILNQFAEAFNQGEPDVFERLMARDFYNYSPAAGRPTAPEVFAPLAADLASALDGLHLEVGDFADEGDTVSFSMTLSGTSAGTLWGAPPSGEQVTWTSTASAKLIDGRVAIAWPNLAVPDMLGTLRAVNVVPPPDDMDKPMKHPVAIPENIIRVVFTGQMADKPCSHLGDIKVIESDAVACPQCVEMGDIWPALRMCLICGFVGCCDTSKNKHMKAHYEETGHSLFRSIRMEENWVWCYEDNAFFSGEVLRIDS